MHNSHPAAVDYQQGLEAFQRHQVTQAIGHFQAALPLTPEPEYQLIIQNMLGILHTYISQYSVAESYFKACLALQSTHPASLYYLAQMARLARDFPLALQYLQTLILHQGADLNTIFALANLYDEMGATQEALDYYQQLLIQMPQHGPSHFFLARILGENGQTDLAQSHFLQSCRLHPAYLAFSPDRETVQTLLQEIELELNSTVSQAGVEKWLRQLYHLPYINFETHAKLIFAWGDQLKQNSQMPPLDLALCRPKDRLRIGYLSYKFCRFTSTPTLSAFMRHHDHTCFEICLLADLAQEDEKTQAFRSWADRFENIQGYSDAALCELIRAWEIDILVDLSGHAPGTRLPIFAQRPAPVLVGTPLGFASSTGLADYYLVDDALIAQGGEALFNETLIPMTTALVWEPPLNQFPPPVADYVFTRSFYFGYCNQAQKISFALAQVWGEILAALPETQLRLKCPSFNEPQQRYATQLLLEKAGVPLARVHFEGYSEYAEYLRFFEEVALLLDPFPFQGGVTTCDALWMGMPVLSVWSPGRVGNGFLLQTGQEDLLCVSLAEYRDRAILLAQNPAALYHRRSEIQARFLASPLCQGETFARELEQIYREIWTGKYPPKTQ